MNKPNRLLETMQNVYESLPYGEDTTEAKRQILAVITELEEYIAESEDRKASPPWLTFVWECVIFVSTVLITAAFVIRTSITPSKSHREAPTWAWGAVKQLERIFKSDRQIFVKSYRETSFDFQNLRMRTEELRQEYNNYEE